MYKLYIGHCIAHCIAYCPSIVLPIVLPVVLPIVSGSCSLPIPGPDRVLGRTGLVLAWGEPGWGGGKGVISCTSSITFHLVARKKIYIYSSILTFRYASFGDDEIGKISYRWLDCYFTDVKPQIQVNIGKNSKNPQQNTYVHEISHFLFLGRPESWKKRNSSATGSKSGWAQGPWGP